MKTLRRAFAPGLAVAAALGIVPVADAATVAVPAPCVRIVPGVPTFPVQASGFPAGAFLTFKTGTDIVGTGNADPAGNFDNSGDPSTWFEPASIPLKKNTTTVQLTADDGAGTVAGPVPVRVSRVTVTGPDGRVAVRKRVRFRVFGFVPGKKVYLHIRRGGKTKGRFTIGRAKAPCGLTSKRMRFMPLKNYRTGVYDYAFTQSKKYKKSEVLGGGPVTISTTRVSAAQATAAGAWG